MKEPEERQENFASVTELASKLEMAEDDVISSAAEINIHPLSNGHFRPEEVASILTAVARSRGHAFAYFKLPEDLQQSAVPWARTLVRMYRDSITCPSSLSPAQGSFIRQLICNLRPKVVLEIGCFTGVSTVWMASGLEEAAPDATVHSVDLFSPITPALTPYQYLNDPLEYAQNHVRQAGLEHRVRFHKMNSQRIGKLLNTIPSPIDLAFIDGDHSFGGCLTDLVNLFPYLAAGGIIMLHDIYLTSGVSGPRDVIDAYVRRNQCFDIVEVDTAPQNFGLALIKKKKAGHVWSPFRRVRVLARALRHIFADLFHDIRARLANRLNERRGAPQFRASLRDLYLVARLMRN